LLKEEEFQEELELLLKLLEELQEKFVEDKEKS